MITAFIFGIISFVVATFATMIVCDAMDDNENKRKEKLIKAGHNRWFVEHYM